jgi:formate hydrogenlyase subunit 3/multisubunit Na+/H+ antiporter MnhD subunit
MLLLSQVLLRPARPALGWLVSLPLHIWRRSSLPLAALVNVFALAGSAAAGVAGAFGLGLLEPLRWQAPVSAPWLELPVRLDPLSAFFLLAMAALAVPVSLYSLATSATARMGRALYGEAACLARCSEP